MKKLSIVCLLLLLVGCASPIFSGTKPGAGEAEFSNDLLQCRALSKKLDNYESPRTIQTCMRGKGWKMDPVRKG